MVSSARYLPDPKPIRTAVGISAVAAGLFALGWDLLNGHPIPAVFLMVASVLYLIYELATSRMFVDNVPPMLRFLAVVMVTCVLAGICIPRFQHPLATEVKIKAHYMTQVYSSGTVIGNVIFGPEYTDFRVTIENPTDGDYRDLDLTVTTDLSILAGGQLAPFPVVTFIDPEMVHTEQLDADGVSVVHVLMPRHGFRGVKDARMRCEILPKHASVELVLAVTKVSPRTINGVFKMYERQAPVSASFKGDFHAEGKTVALV
jgi:hypothetical protein